MSQQLVKYCYTYNTRCAGICDVENLALFYLQGDPQEWMSNTPRAASPVKVLARWYNKASEMKRAWFVFNDEALRLKLGDSV
jgi:hypothetical protein